MSDSEQLASDLSLCEENCKLLEDALAAANERIREVEIERDKWESSARGFASEKGECNKDWIHLKAQLTAERAVLVRERLVSDKLEKALKAYVDDSREVDVGGGDFVCATCESRYLATTTLAEVAAIRKGQA